MTSKLLIFVIFVSFYSYSQKTYHFDTLLTYNNVVNDSIIKTHQRFINSKDNSFFLSFTTKNDTSSLYFKDFGKIVHSTQIPEALLNKVDTISISNSYNLDLIKPKNKIIIEQLEDSIIQGVSYNHYVLKLKNKRKEERLIKKDKLLTEHFLTKKNNSPTVTHFLYPSESKNLIGTLYMYFTEDKFNTPKLILTSSKNVNLYLKRDELSFLQKKQLE
jgi:hypothetical protein